MKKILMIGGTGTISSSVTEMLAQDHDVDLYVLNRGNNNAGLPERVSFIKGDINQTDEMQMLLKDNHFDCVINFIVWNGEQAKKNIEIFNDRTKQFIYISTVCVLNRETDCNVSEDNEKGNAYSGYGQAKAEAEIVFLGAREEIGFPVTIVRPSQTYSKNRIPLSIKGKGCWSVVSRMLRGKEVIIHGDGQSVWASTHADDFAPYFCKLVGDPSAIGEVYQIMNPEPHTWDMIYQELARLLKVEYKPVYMGTDLLRMSRSYNFEESIQGDKRWSNIFDTSKVKEKLPDYSCQISYRQGLRMYLDYMEAHPELKVEEPEFDEWCDRTIQLYKEMAAAFTAEI
jgi:nucleoside-diphosphate-sugar epimerase